jgi:hypothetical protein
MRSILRALCAIAALVAAVSAQATLFTLLPVADTYTSEKYPTLVHGDRGYIKAQDDTWDRYGFMQFDVPNQAYTWAQLRLNCDESSLYVNDTFQSAATTTFLIQRCDGTPWIEYGVDGLDWGTTPQPAPDPAFSSVSASATTGAWSTVALPAIWFNGGGLITMRLQMATPNGMASFWSHEKNCSGPKLDLDGKPVPEPASCALLALAAGGVAATLRKRRKT